MTRLTRCRQRYLVDVELPYIELLGSQSPVYDETLAECCGEMTDPSVLGSSYSSTDTVTSDWEWMQEYGDISVLENCPGLYEKCININDICCRHDRHVVTGPTLAELNERRALSPLIHPDMKRLHLVATENCDGRLEAPSDNNCNARQSRPCLTELNRPIPRRPTSEENFVSVLPAKKFDRSSSLRKVLLYGLNRPGALNSNFYKVDYNAKETVNSISESDTTNVSNKEVLIKEENISADEEIHSDSDSEIASNASDKDIGINDDEDDYLSSEDNNDEETPVKRFSGQKRKRSEADDWTPDPKKLLEIGKQLERLNKIINGLRPVGNLSANAKNRTRREKNKLASRACRLKKKAGHEANKIKLFGLNQENKHLSEVIYDIKSLLIVGPADKRKKTSFDKLRDEAERVLAEQICGKTQDYIDSMLKKYASGGDCILIPN